MRARSHIEGGKVMLRVVSIDSDIQSPVLKTLGA